jgi:hypothetical protein
MWPALFLVQQQSSTASQRAKNYDFLGKIAVAQLVQKYFLFMVPEGSLP